MSILLDALKKSEEQRQLGKTPNIHSSMDSDGSASGGGLQWVPMALFTLAAIAMAWIGWQQFRVPPLAEDPGSVEVAAVADPATQGRGETPSLTAGRGDQAAPDSTEPSADASSPQVAARPTPRTPVESFKPDVRESQDAAAEPSTVSQAAPPQAERFEPAVAASRAGENARPAAAAPGDTPDQPRAARAPAHVSEPISFWELPQGVRDSLGEMRITVLVYAERPEDRFLLINGKRVIEEEVYEPGVVLEEIRRDGAIFRYRTYRFLVEG